MTRTRTIVALALVLVVSLARAQSPTPPAKPDPPPVLADVDRLKVINALQAVEIAALKLQAARADADKVIAGVQVPGWILNEQLEYIRPPKGGGTSPR